ncbi:MAG: patatin-like phospholipase family protein [Pseudomonadota bacterium]
MGKPQPVVRGSRRFNLGLQGGGSHGAFTWGVLDRILEDPRLIIDSITGASAGAMNAVVVAHGIATGGREEARADLRKFWTKVGTAAKTSPIQRSALAKWLGDWSLDWSPGYAAFDIMSRVASPYDINPTDINPLRDILSSVVSFEAVRACDQIGLYISATNVETGRVDVFEQKELTVDHVLASACLPTLFKAVEIEGVPYWDGGYMGNPPLFPLFDNAESDDVIIVQINPLSKPGAPKRARDILNRINEITFNASLLRELRAIDFVTRLLDDGRLEGTGYRRVLVHMIGDEETLGNFGASSKLNAEQAFLDLLFEKGYAAADNWIARHHKDIGRRSTINLRRMFSAGEDPLGIERIKRPSKYQMPGTGS